MYLARIYYEPSLFHVLFFESSDSCLVIIYISDIKWHLSFRMLSFFDINHVLHRFLMKVGHFYCPEFIILIVKFNHSKVAFLLEI